MNVAAGFSGAGPSDGSPLFSGWGVAGFFPADPPARSAVEVARLPKDALVEIEAIAVRPGIPHPGGRIRPAGALF